MPVLCYEMPRECRDKKKLGFLKASGLAVGYEAREPLCKAPSA